MVKLEYTVNHLAKIGPKYKKILEKLGIETIEDLLYHFPFRYDDFTNIKNISDIQNGETVTVKGVLEKVDNIYTKNRKKLTLATVSDGTGRIQIVWFNQHWIKSNLKTGVDYQFSGKAEEFNHKTALIAPDYEEVGKSAINTGRLVPVYPETYGVSSKYIRTRINDVLSQVGKFDDFLPEELKNKRKLIDFDRAVRQIHFPDTEFESRHALRRFGFEELFLELLIVESRKYQWGQKLSGNVFDLEKHRSEIEKMIKGLPFELTDSQKTAVEEILADTTLKHPMNRLLEGDVGTGKTVVAVITAYFARLNGFKTLYMAPTEILANQHYATFTSLLEKLGVKISLVTGSKKPADSRWDILIGTHALLFKENVLNNVGLVVIDEQHRFGVEQRAKLLEADKNGKVPHLLTMTATPIPRTLALTLFGDLSISALKTSPNKDKKITTVVIPESKRDDAYELIKKKNEPTFIVCPLIEESESISLENVKAAEAEYKSLKEGVFKGLEVGLLHGRMKSKEKQETIEKFKKGEIRILVSTPVIEVGIDIPEATVMVIESAERYGLASLHQLRGRVGRGDKPGVCLVFMSNNSQSSYERLKNLERVSNGLELAEIDMKIRGYGDLYGTMQHGFKQLKVASLEDLELLEQTKLEAQNYFPLLDQYPTLKEKVSRRSGKLVGNN